MNHHYTARSALLLCLLVSPTMSSAQSHLVLSEVSLAPSAGEFIEFYNPTASAITLDNYYLADNSAYAFVPSGAVILDATDFIVRFPAGHTIQPGQVMVVAMNGVDFVVNYFVTPDFEIVSQSPSVVDMLQIFTSGTPALTNAGEEIVLFYWDGSSDLVRDVDMMNVGIPSVANRITAKTGLMVDGPDGDAIPSTYLADAATIPLQSSTPGTGFSTKRRSLEGGFEISAGGNGITGHDETSEATTTTWDATFSAPDPGVGMATTGVEGTPAPLHRQLALSVSPTLAGRQTTIAWEAGAGGIGSLDVCDIRGRRVATLVSGTMEPGHHVLEWAPYARGNGSAPAGVYFVRLSVAGTTHVVRVVLLNQ